MTSTIKTYVKMCGVGLIGTLLQLVCYSTLRWVNIAPFFANLVAVSLAICNNFTLNHKLTFHHSSSNDVTWKHRFLRFVMFSIVTASLQSTLVHFLTMPVHNKLFYENIIVFIIIALTSIINFYGYRRFVWPVKL